MRTMLLVTCALAWAQNSFGYCTTSGHPGTVGLDSHVVEIPDDDAWKQGRTVWMPAAVRADAKLFAWLVWTDRPTGQGCVVTLKARQNDHCGPRLDIQFEQRTPYNVGFAASDMPGANTTYPYLCSTELVFHIFDSGQMVPNPMYDPNDPNSPQFIIDPGYDFYSLVTLRVTGEQMMPQGGMPSTPDGVTRNGECPTPQPDDEFPAFMLTGPGCPGGGNVRVNSVTSGATASATSWQAMTQTASTMKSGQVAQSIGGTAAAKRPIQQQAAQRQSAASIRSASRAKLTAMLQQMSANTVRGPNGRPQVRLKTQ